MRSKTKCAHCGAPILLIKISPNRTKLCDANPVKYWQHDDGDDTIVTPRGDVVNAVITDKYTTDLGYIPHKQTCTNYKGKGGSL